VPRYLIRPEDATEDLDILHRETVFFFKDRGGTDPLATVLANKATQNKNKLNPVSNMSNIDLAAREIERHTRRSRRRVTESDEDMEVLQEAEQQLKRRKRKTKKQADSGSESGPGTLVHVALSDESGSEQSDDDRSSDEDFEEDADAADGDEEDGEDDMEDMVEEGEEDSKKRKPRKGRAAKKEKRPAPGSDENVTTTVWPVGKTVSTNVNIVHGDMFKDLTEEEWDAIFCDHPYGKRMFKGDSPWDDEKVCLFVFFFLCFIVFFLQKFFLKQGVHVSKKTFCIFASCSATA
jgi:hypothetical protein